MTGSPVCRRSGRARTTERLKGTDGGGKSFSPDPASWFSHCPPAAPTFGAAGSDKITLENGSDPALLHEQHGRLRAIGDADLAENPLELGLDGLARDRQVGRDLLIGQAIAHKAQNRLFAKRQRRPRPLRIELVRAFTDRPHRRTNHSADCSTAYTTFVNRRCFGIHVGPPFCERCFCASVAGSVSMASCVPISPRGRPNAKNPTTSGGFRVKARPAVLWSTPVLYALNLAVLQDMMRMHVLPLHDSRGRPVASGAPRERGRTMEVRYLVEVFR